MSQDTIAFKRDSSSFLRVADLEMSTTLSMRSISFDSDESQEQKDQQQLSDDLVPNFHHMAIDPPPNVKLDPKERWVVLDDGNKNHAPIAPMAVAALAKSGLKSAFDQQMWSPDGKTSRILKQAPPWNDIVWQSEGAIQLPETGLNEKEILVWSGNFSHGCYGSELPAVRSVGIVDVNPKALLELLVDSSRVKEYNKLCLGRDDILTLQGDDELEGGPFDGITKVMKTESKPPLIRSTLQFTSLMHARQLEDGSGYKIVTRAVTLPETKEDLANSMKSEILLGATILKCIEGHDNKCLFISVNHLRSPMVPTMIAKRIGLSAAVNFISDLRSVPSTV